MRLLHRKEPTKPEAGSLGELIPETASKGTILGWKVYAREVETANTSGCEGFVNMLDSPDLAKSAQGHVYFSFPDYEDAEFVFARPEVRHFVRVLHQRVKHLFYFLMLNPELAQLLEFMAAFSPDDRLSHVGDRLRVQASEQVHQAFLERLVAVWRFAEQVDDNPKRVVRGIAEHVYQPDEFVGLILSFVGDIAQRKSRPEVEKELIASVARTVVERA
jgi:hypothetical protein